MNWVKTSWTYSMIQWDIIGIGIIDLNKTYKSIVLCFFYIKNDVLKCVHAFFSAYIDKVRMLSTTCSQGRKK